MRTSTILLVLGICFAVAAGAGTLSGPVTGGERGIPFAGADVADQGYLIPFIDFGRPVAFASDLAGQRRGSPASIRDDLDVPVIVVNSETEVTSYYGVREADSPRFRLWEVAGTSHVSVARPAEPTEGGSNWMSYSPVYNAAIRHLHHWISDEGTP